MNTDSPRSLSPARPWRAGSRSIVPTAVTESELDPTPDSERVAEARARAAERLHRQRRSLRPLGWAVIFVVVLGSVNSHPVPALHGKGLAVTLALCLFAGTLVIAVRDGFPERSLAVQTAVIAIMELQVSRSPGFNSREPPGSLPVWRCSWRSRGCRSTPVSRWLAL